MTSFILCLDSGVADSQSRPLGGAGGGQVPTASGKSRAGYDAWLRYETLDETTSGASYNSLPAVIVVRDDSLVIRAARDELLRGLRGMLGRTLRVSTSLPGENAIVLGTTRSIISAFPAFSQPTDLRPDGYCLKTLKVDAKSELIVAATNDRGVLYGAFALLRKIAFRQPVDALDEIQDPYAPVRMVDEWDNLDGTIERGYAGPSIFFEKDKVPSELSRVIDYGRLLASVGINSCSINNVNANQRVITSDFLPQLARVAQAFRPLGVRLFVSIDFSSPQKIGGLDSFDPLDPRIAEFWKKKVDEIYSVIPDFGGFVLKADSEGRLGPSAYHRSHADAANVIARPLSQHGGLIFYRGFVYDHHMDWRNPKNDRAAAAYDNFKQLDGQFLDNVVLQIKNGPIDFQVREPASPLFGALENSNQAIELQITQEYTGQQRHLVYLVPMWKEVLDFDMQARGSGTPVKQLVAGRTFSRPVGGFVGVANVGASANWLGHDLAMANLYGFGRLAWNPDLSGEVIAEEWTRLTWGSDSLVVRTITDMLLASWAAYEQYTGPLGAGTLTDIIGVHYGPGIESSERNGWGQWHRADEKGIGMDRTVATGTGFIGQYRAPVVRTYESLASCPDELLLFMHHVPYTYLLHSGKTVIQHIYDSHYEGASRAESFVRQWQSLKGKINEQRYREVLERLKYQAGHAEVWRDAVCTWFLRQSRITDAKGRAGYYPGRVEAEAMKLDGYRVEEVTPWEAASGGKAVACRGGESPCAASFEFKGQPGWYDVNIRYFDQNNGAARFRLLVAGQVVAEWAATDALPSARLDAHSATRYVATGLALRPGDEIVIEGSPDGGEVAALDYVEIHPSRR